MGAGGAGNLTKSDFTSETKGAESFLAAVQAKDPELLAEAVAKHSEFEAVNEHKPIFAGLLAKTSDPKDLDMLSREFADFQIAGMGNRVGSGSVKIAVGKEDEKGMVKRILTLRKEKDGWKVQDYGGRLVTKYPQMGTGMPGSGTTKKKKK